VIDVNESFAATNEREGSDIARQIVHALTESDVRVLLVTHLFELAQSLYDETLDTALFLRADRRDGGHRTFRIRPGRTPSDQLRHRPVREDLRPDPGRRAPDVHRHSATRPVNITRSIP